MKLFKILIMTAVLFSTIACQEKVEKPIEMRIEEQLSKISDMTELATSEYTITKIVKASDKAFYTIGDRKILFSCKAIVKAGIDMKDFSPEDVVYDKENNSMTIHLPLPRVLTMRVPSEDVKLEFKKVDLLRSDFTSVERNELLRQGESDIKASLPQLDILKDAKENAKIFFESLFSLLGIETVDIYFDKI